MAKVNICDVLVMNNPAPFKAKLEFEITFECLESLSSDLEWKMTYVGSPESEEFDQILETIAIGPVPEGMHKFVFSADPPNSDKLPESEVLECTVVLLTCSYMSKEFVHYGYFVNNEYVDPELQETPPEKPDFDKLQRDILATNPRVTNIKINWDSSTLSTEDTPADKADNEKEPQDTEVNAALQIETENELSENMCVPIKLNDSEGKASGEKQNDALNIVNEEKQKKELSTEAAEIKPQDTEANVALEIETKNKVLPDACTPMQKDSGVVTSEEKENIDALTIVEAEKQTIELSTEVEHQDTMVNAALQIERKNDVSPNIYAPVMQNGPEVDTSDNKENADTINVAMTMKQTGELSPSAKRGLKMSPESAFESASKMARTCSRKKEFNEIPMESGDRLCNQKIHEDIVPNDKIISPDAPMTNAPLAECDQQSSSGNDTTTTNS